MQLIFTLLVLTPLVYCATLTNEEQLVIQAMTSEQKRALLANNIPTVRDIKVATCKYLTSTAAKISCIDACHVAIRTIQYGILASPLCDPICNTLHC